MYKLVTSRGTELFFSDKGISVFDTPEDALKRTIAKLKERGDTFKVFKENSNPRYMKNDITMPHGKRWLETSRFS